ncbi:DUF262 domain-containing protein [Acinetobacter junii]|uniref:DUF262 domain-containing protein n=1 Tax=Acinetobacter junii TaxID=40215 RepID=UPI003A8504CF
MSKPQELIIVAVCNVSQLLSGKLIKTESQKYIQGQLSIPEYQRPYVWGEKQIDKLINDLKDHKQQFNSSPYYLGSVILHSQDGYLNIIDGQQRLTTLALLGYLNSQLDDVSLSYQASLSIQHIQQNLGYLEKIRSKWEGIIDFENIVVSLVVTESEDDAYKFFETQNTGGVRLTGPDIIKAHHLRAVPEDYRNHYAKQWEDLGDLQSIVMTLLRGRYWNSLNNRIVPFYQEKQKIRDEIVEEFANRTLKNQDDVAFGNIRVTYTPMTKHAQQHLQNSYQLRQPLNEGINSISYVEYFQDLYRRYYKDLTVSYLPEYVGFIKWLKELEGCRFLGELFVTGLMLYLCQFGEYKLEIFAQKFFRVAYSKRVSNKKAVRADSIPEFLREHKTLDLIAYSFTPEQVFESLDRFNLKVDPNGLDDNSVKRDFVDKSNTRFGLGIPQAHLAEQFSEKLTQKLRELG